jgi:large subunit ribosomal protein L4
MEVKDAQGKVLEERELPEELFGSAVNVAVMHQVVVAGLAARRAGTQSTKTRAEVAGGGKKPWRQKGTGRARQGSIRAPQWMGGGVSHGPKPRSYETRVNRKMKKAALRSALSDAARSEKLALVSGLSFDGPRTKDALGVLEAFGLEGNVLLVIAGPDEALEKSFRNLAQVKIDYPGNLSTYDLLYADRVLLTTEALAVLAGQAPEEAEPSPEPKASKPKTSKTEPAPPEPKASTKTEPAPKPEQGQDETEVGP